MRRRIPLPVHSALAAVAGLLWLAAPVAEAHPVVAGAAGVYVGPAYGARWVGGPYYRPWVRPGWGGWGVGYPGYGWGYGWGGYYGAGWGVSLAPAWGWSVAPPTYVVPSWVPMETAVAPPLFEERLAPAPPAPQPQAAPPAQGQWYYCTEPAGYYPYVSTCSRPWIAVRPTH